ncbi:hypothetical protein FRX31_014389 [Thalictrum thalictroides]|uniref:Uncharacterized protein n=1 Tax=Thalictrum thalictroides TaxID=46969 RepID=A0A7J6WGD2_THATH|nr:hypothetical protein FRX31_014389 [Thalictrum thalictroides]
MAELKLEENGDGEHAAGLVKEDDTIIQNSAKSREVVSDVEDSNSSSTSKSETKGDDSSTSSSSLSSEEDADGDEEREMDVAVEEGEIKDFDPKETLIGSDEAGPALSFSRPYSRF